MARTTQKQLYIRKGNTEDTKDILIIGEESQLGGRDLAYKLSKGSIKPKFLKKKDPYSGSENLLYIHVTPNIILQGFYNRDYSVHNFIKQSCSDIVTWDGECEEGRVCSREAFIIKGDINKTIEELYNRLENVINNKNKSLKRIKRNKIIKNIILFPFKLALTIFLALFLKKRKLKKAMKKLW